MEWSTWPGGEWKTLRRIGKGAYGEVYEIERHEFGKVYKAAMKVLRIAPEDGELQSMQDSGMTPEEIRAYYSDYARLLAKEFAFLSTLKGYTNIVSYEDHKLIRDPDGIGWTILIRMELLTPLKQYIRQNPCREETVIRIGTDLCRALEICHERKIIHRDIKIDNIFVNARGDFELGDFGVARIMERTVSSMTVTGTPGFMAPEIFWKKPYGPNADLYSLGIVLYMLMNRMRGPFLPMDRRITPDDPSRAIEARMSGRRIPPPLYGSDRLKEAVLKAIAYKPEERFGCAQDFRKALEGEEKISPLEAAYRQALLVESHAETWMDYEKAETAYNILGDYKDSRACAERCRREASFLKAEEALKNEIERETELDRNWIETIGGDDGEESGTNHSGRKRSWLKEGAAAVFASALGIDSNEYREIDREVWGEDDTRGVRRTAEGKAGPLSTGISLQMGDRFTFGRYEQYRYKEEPEPIEWIVLFRQKDRALILAKEILEVLPYNKDMEDNVWKTCSLRAWLNENFLKEAFNEGEKKRILKARLWNVQAGYETTDRIFLLSSDEAERFLASDESRIAFPTVYAQEQGAWINKRKAGLWWLRSPGGKRMDTAAVNFEGNIDWDGDYVQNEDIGVRPALWLQLDPR